MLERSILTLRSDVPIADKIGAFCNRKRNVDAESGGYSRITGLSELANSFSRQSLIAALNLSLYCAPSTLSFTSLITSSGARVPLPSSTRRDGFIKRYWESPILLKKIKIELNTWYSASPFLATCNGSPSHNS